MTYCKIYDDDDGDDDDDAIEDDDDFAVDGKNKWCSVVATFVHTAG